MESLVEVAETILKDEDKIDPETKQNMEETLLENIVETAKEVEKDKTEDDVNALEGDYAVRKFLANTDILKSDDPYQDFLLSQV